MEMDTLIFGILICIVIILFISVYHNNTKFTNVTNIINTIEQFDETNPVTTPQLSLPPDISFKDNCGNDIEPISYDDKIPFIKSDDYHNIIISNVPTELYNAPSLTISFMTQSGNNQREYTGVDLETIKTSANTGANTSANIGANTNTLTIKQSLTENSKYVLKISAKNVISELKFIFTTDYNTFKYNINPPLVVQASEADNYLYIGIKKQTDPESAYIYQLNITSSNALIPSDGNYTYNLKIPNFNNYITNVITQLQTDKHKCLESEYKELTKYIPFKFDALLTVNRTKDSYPLEVIILPSINCINTNKCMISLRNLRKNTEYNIKIRLVYFKMGSDNNYRSSPMIQWSFNTGDTGDTFFDTVEQINKLLLLIKNGNINTDIFNKEQTIQNNRLNTIENEKNKIVKQLQL